MAKQKYLRDKAGNILKDANGNPMPLDNFENDSSGKYWEATKNEPDWAPLERHLEAGGYVPENILKKNGFKKVNGKWVHPDS